MAIGGEGYILSRGIQAMGNLIRYAEEEGEMADLLKTIAGVVSPAIAGNYLLSNRSSLQTTSVM